MLLNARPADAVDFSTVKRVLVTKLKHHGDVLLTTPVFSVLKAHAPQVEIDALIYAETRPLLEGHPAISQIHTIDRGWKTDGWATQLPAELALWKTLNARRYDGVIHLSDHARGTRLAKLKGVRFSVAPKSAGRESAAFSHVYPLPRQGNQRHTVETNLDALRRLGVQPALDGRKLTLIPTQAEEARVASLLGELRLAPKQFIHLHPASRWFFKCWPVAQNAALIDALAARGHTVVLTGAPTKDETDYVNAIIAQCKSAPKQLVGQLSLRELAALTAEARLFVGVDSAPMHLAAAMQTPCVALFGPSGDIEWGPWQVPCRIVTSNHACRPCGFDGCGGGKVSECLTTLPVQTALDAIESLLAQIALTPTA